MTTDQVREALESLLCNLTEGRDLVAEGLLDRSAWLDSMRETARAALSAATEGDGPPPADERVQLLERLLGHEAGLICAWAKEPAKHEAKLKAWAEVLERRVPDAPPPEPKSDATAGVGATQGDGSARR